ncbi:WD repeat-containing protein 76 [Carcharodon carcharias]|uniref:WD repeat-containing protein 76 n=1 Tax=Carcharodon carcharias TaxID=13397 RepID=UPI001B7DAC98|nr:WD repeat-containing protein 76 [Carcharodon carcharias]
MKPAGNRRSLRQSTALGRRQKPAAAPPSRKRPGGDGDEEPLSRRPMRRMTRAGSQPDHAPPGGIPPVPAAPVETDSDSSNQTDSGSSSDDELPLAFHRKSEELSVYEKKRLKNIQENAQFFASLNMLETANKLREIGKRQPIKRRIAPRREKLKSSGEQPTVRRSMRLLRLEPTGTPLPEIPIETQMKVEEIDERIPGPLKMVGNDEEDSKVTENLINTWLEISQGEMHIEKKQSVELKKYKSSLNRMTIQEGFVAKVTTKRVCSLALHPSQHRFLVAAGSTSGHVGLWDLSSQADGILEFKPHCGPVNCLHFSPSNSAELLSLSNDGSIRCGNVATAVFDQVYTSDTWNTSSFDFLAEDGSTLIVSHWDGDVAIVDRRTPSISGELDAYLGIKHLRTVSVHPVHRQYFVTAAARCVTIYDVRNLKTSHKEAVAHTDGHRKNVNSAYFSPVTGNRVVTIGLDDRIRIFDTSAIIPKIPVVASIIHNNFTGRWLTKFRAVWDPKREDVFVVGSMTRPRQIEAFHNTGYKVHEFRDAEWLGSVCSINVMHPTKNVLVGGNSSGRLHVFMDNSLSG